MNAILLFDPTNDLIFSQSDLEFRARVTRYAKSNNLIARVSSFRASSYGSKAKSASNAQYYYNKSQELCPSTSDDEDNYADNIYNDGCQRARGSTASIRRASNSSFNDQIRAYEIDGDNSKQFLDIIMLLLTPYVASLRIQSSQQQRQHQKQQQQDQLRKQQHSRGSDAEKSYDDSGAETLTAGNTSSSPEQNHERNNLFYKFIDSINIEQERVERHLEQSRTMTSSESKFASIQIPVECLSSCQVVYSDIDNFMFVYLQELETVSSSKMRLLQKRIDTFARLALLLCGPALDCLRISPTNIEHFEQSSNCFFSSSQRMNQAKILRNLYQVWLDEQYDFPFLLQAHEPLLLSQQVEDICRSSLRHLAISLRSKSTEINEPELHMHSLLFADNKLVERHSCKNGYPLMDDDLITILLLLKAHRRGSDAKLAADRHSSKSVSDRKSACVYLSNYQTNRLTNEISSRSRETGPDTSLGIDMKARKRKSINKRKVPIDLLLPDEFLVFLSATKNFHSQVNPIRIPYMIRFVSLNNPPNKHSDPSDQESRLTLALLSEISTSYLGIQLHRSLKIIHQLARGPDRKLCLDELAKFNECIVAIRSFFQPNSTSTDQEQTTSADSKQGSLESPSRQFSSNWSISSLFKKNHPTETSNPGYQPCESPRTNMNIPKSFRYKELYMNEEEKRQGKRLVSLMEELAANNVLVYMRQTFNMIYDQNKRDALFSSITNNLRESFKTFVINKEMQRFSKTNTNMNRDISSWQEGSKFRLAIETFKGDLTDCIDYLEVKPQCNITMGPPITHDMPALLSFVYLDRSQNSMLTSPMKKAESKFEDPLFKNSHCNIGDTLVSETFNVGDKTRDSNRSHPNTDLSSSSSSGSESSSGHHGDSESDSDGTLRVSKRLRQKLSHSSTIASLRRQDRSYSERGSLFEVIDKKLLGSNGLISESSRASSETMGSSSQAINSESRSNRINLNRLLEMDVKETLNHSQNLLDDNLMKSFVYLIQDRAAEGRCYSSSDSDGTYVFSYFIWFEHDSVRYLTDTIRQA